jgi:phage terminase large subunit GpA-like protein
MGCGNGEEAWTIGHKIILGNTGQLAPWAALDQRLRETVLQTEFGKPLRVRATCIDLGGHRGSMVLGCARTRTAHRTYATNGVPNAY